MFLGHRNHDEFWVSELLKSSYDHFCKWAACGNPEEWFLGVKLWYLQQAPLPTPAVGHKHSDKMCMAFAYYFNLCDYKVHIYVYLGFGQQSSMGA